MRRVAAGLAVVTVGGVVALWLVALTIAGAAYADRAAERIGERLAESIQGTSRVGTASLSLVLGRFVMRDLHVGRDDAAGKLALDVRDIDCDLPPLGLALAMRTCNTLEVSGVRLEVSSASLFQLRKPRRPPPRADHVVVDDATIELAPSALVPGIGAIRVDIVHAEAGPTRLVTALSWLFALQAMEANVALPAGIRIRLTYADGMLRAQGSVFGAEPVGVPLAIPRAGESDDARTQLRALAALGTRAATQLVARRAEDWVRGKLGL